MAGQPPRVSLGLPVYNGEKYLANTLTRLLEQDFQDFELIISDNASTDATHDICHAFTQRDRRIRYSRNDTNIGLAANHNRAFALSRGEFFKWAAYDDDFPRPMLARFVEAFDRSPRTVSLVFSHCEYIDELGTPEWVDSDGIDTDDPRSHRRLARVLANVHMYNCVYGLIRSEALRRTRLYGLYPMSDHVLFAELAMLGSFIEIPEPLLRIRRHPERTFTATRDPKRLRELFHPGHGSDFSFLTMKARMEVELIRSSIWVPTGFTDKVACTAVAAVSPQWRNFKNFVGKQRRKLFGTWPTAVRPSDQRGSQ